MCGELPDKALVRNGLCLGFGAQLRKPKETNKKPASRRCRGCSVISHSQHEQLATPDEPEPPIPSPPVHILHAVPRTFAPSATLAAFAPFVTYPRQWSIETELGMVNADTASFQGDLWMLDVLVKLFQLGRYPPGTTLANTLDGMCLSDDDDEQVQGTDQDQVDSVTAGLGEEGDSDMDGYSNDEDDEYYDDDNDAQDQPHSALMDSKCPFMYSEHALNAASADNRVHVLDWWLKLHRQDPELYPLLYSESALDSASWNGHVQVLDWWLDSGLELRFSWAALADASEAGRVYVLDWWLRAEKEGKLKRDCSSRVLDRASFGNHVSVLDWWVDKGELPSLIGKYSDQAIAVAASRGHVDVLKWWKAKSDAGVFPPTAWAAEKVARSASSRLKMKVLDWMLEEGVLTDAVKKDLVRKLSFADGAEFNEWKPEVREWWVNEAGVVVPPAQ
ncbi:hypothetical protein BCR44DRAFT_45256 [Catenaria anguillulae PL171]|uniref:Ankyrin repeat-containing domain protein n=1 Tax=Catenaria anguillulae PL171 TaxID=765915 RepID=A0A1Y2HMM7_9FUNG|nr:hypothetical protein BCR44DRAFT_45256 [Catenaria anguillulae PL171]